MRFPFSLRAPARNVVFIAVCLGLMAVGFRADADTAIRREDERFPSCLLLADHNVQKELAIGREQIARMLPIGLEFARRLAIARQADGRLPTGPELKPPPIGPLTFDQDRYQRSSSRRLTYTYNLVFERELQPDQVRRLRQIQIQLYGVERFTKCPEMSALKLSSSQLDRIANHQIDMLKSAQRELDQAKANRRKSNENSTTIVFDQLEVIAIRACEQELTAEQRKVYAELIGAPLSFSHRQVRMIVPVLDPAMSPHAATINDGNGPAARDK